MTIKLKTIHEVIEETIASDPEFKKQWYGQMLARELSYALTLYRTRRGMTQDQLAAVLGVSQPVLARWEQARGIPQWRTVRMLSRKLGLTVTINIKPDFTCAVEVAQP